ncbi:MAG: UvrD-helicase domain-containing protein [Candidatus Competibacteraceae bacterium]|nr:UvrD-helicase domain-containing protein [Candidatus Competibacteraceae bacterium]
MKLNLQQEEAANHVDGPCLVIAVPGAGKTGVLTHRTARLIESGVPARHIVCVTFTNKAAAEMSERIAKRLGVTKLECFVGTFHRLCATLLRKFGHKVGLRKNFTIIDSDEQIDLIRQIARQEGRKLEKSEAQNISRAINNWRETLGDRNALEDVLDGIDFNILVADRYFERLEQDNLVDFSGLLYKAIQVLDENKDILERVQEQTRYLQIDETQDTNLAQFYFINLISAKWNNVFCVGDLSQCVAEETIVKTPTGDTPIENLTVGDEVVACIGGGRTTVSKVQNVYKKFIDTVSIRVGFDNSKELKFTPDHIIPAGFIERPCSNKCFVYLMQKDDMGFRLGTTRHYKDRLQQDGADRLWVIATTDSSAEASYWEHFYSVKYGIPTWCFKLPSDSYGEYDQSSIEKLYSNIASNDGATRLLEDLGFNPKYPTIFKSRFNHSSRANISIIQGRDGRRGLHGLYVSTTRAEDKDILVNLGLKVKRGKIHGYHSEVLNGQLSVLKQLYDQILEFIPDIEVREYAKFADESLPLIPAAHLLPGMLVFSIKDDGSITTKSIKSVERVPYRGHVYDIDVERYHNFIANDIAVRNSIYKFRGARHKNIQDFIRKHENCRIIELPLNYRSTPQIVKTADKLIRHNKSHMAEQFIAHNPDGEDVRVIPFHDQSKEAEFIAKQINRLVRDGGWNANDIAILYRMNSMSEPIERALTNERIDYEVFGGRSFYDRKEVKDSLAMLRFMSNPQDGVAFHRIATLMPGLGDVTIGKIEASARQTGVSILKSCEAFANANRSEIIRSSCDKLVKIFTFDFADKTPAESLNHAVERLMYHQYLLDNYKDDGSDRVRNVTSLIDSAAGFDSGTGAAAMEKYLQMVALITSNDKEKKRDRVSLMTLHSSKGLEFPIVFMIGVEHNILPHSMSLAEDPVEGIEEERRLCYVGMTRAERLLYLTYCRNRAAFQKGKGAPVYKKTKPSQFLFEAGLIKENQKIIA